MGEEGHREDDTADSVGDCISLPTDTWSQVVWIDDQSWESVEQA